MRLGRLGDSNVVSNVGKYLFGFSTEKDVRKLSSRIQALEGQAENLTHLSNNQFSYIKAVATQALDNRKNKQIVSGMLFKK